MITTLLLTSLAVGITVMILPGVSCTPWYICVVVAAVLGIINTFIRPIVKLVALPINIITLGLFSLVINALMVEMCDWIVTGFEVSTFGSAFLFSIILSVVNWALSKAFS